MIEVINLSKRFDGHEVLRHLNIEVRSGETLVIIGRSGCGKSVLLKHMIGLMVPDRGQVFVDGRELALADTDERDLLRMKFGMVFQGGALFDSMTVGENVGFSLAEHTTREPSVIDERVAECLSLVGLSNIEDLMPAELSGGMKKRVALARAICMEPEIVLYDEPTTGLDPIMADAVNDLIISLNQQLQVTSVVVTHDMTSAYKIASRIAMLYEGQIVQVGTPDDIRETKNPIVRQFITGAASGPITNGGGR